MGTRWRGLLAPLGVSTGDERRFAPDGATHRELPLPLKWQRIDTGGHDTSVIVGSLETINTGTVTQAIDAEWIGQDAVAGVMTPDTLGIWGSGELFDDADPQTLPHLAEDTAEAIFLTSKGVIGPSVDVVDVNAVVVAEGSDEPLTDEDYEALWWAADQAGEDIKLEILFTHYEIAAATLVGIPAFAQCQPFELLAAAELALTAAVRSQGWGDIPLAPRDTTWDKAAAAERLAGHCSDDALDFGCYAQGFLHIDDQADPETVGAYGFGIVDVLDGGMVIVPEAVYAVAGALDGARGGTTIPETDQETMRGVVAGLYARMAEEFDDPTIVVPWDTSEDAAARKKKGKCSVTAAQYAALTDQAPSFDRAWFDDPHLDTITPITVTDDGRVFGHIATHDVCHVGIRDLCMTAPVDQRDYGLFNRYPLDVGDGQLLAAGRLTVGHGDKRDTCACCRGNDDHACSNLTAAAAMAHHDQLTTVAWVRAYEDEANDAIVVAGAVHPGATVEDLAALQRRKVSGDWRDIGGSLSLVEVLVLSRERPGFPLPRARVAGGRMASLTAACVVAPTPPPAEDQGGLDLDRLADKVAARVLSHLATMTQPTEVDPVAEAPGPDPEVAAQVADLSGEMNAMFAGPALADLERLLGPLAPAGGVA